MFKRQKNRPHKIESILNISENEDFNKLKDEAISGNKAKINRLLADTIFDKDNNNVLFEFYKSRINKLDEIENLKTKKINPNPELIISSLKPPVFWKDKPILAFQSSKWNKSKLKKALQKLMKLKLILNQTRFVRKELLIKNLIIDLCNVANGP